MKFDPDTMIRPKQLRQILKRNKKERWQIVDTSGNGYFGYDFTLVLQKSETVKTTNHKGEEISFVVWKDNKTVALSRTVFFNESKNNIGGIGAYGPVFLVSDIPNEAITDMTK